MEKTATAQREERLQKLFDDCQQQVLSQIIGPFGLSLAMFEDKNGGNVTTLKNFSREDDSYVASDSDKLLYAHSRQEYDEDVRARYEVDTQQKASTAGGKTWKDKRDERIAGGRDQYTGAAVNPDGTTTTAQGDTVSVELDHVVSIAEAHATPKNHLALGTVTVDPATGEPVVDASRIREMVNHDDNLALTNKPANASKKDKDLKDWAGQERADGSTNAEHFGLDDEQVDAAYDKARAHADRTADTALLKKQTTELLQTGGRQAALMGMRQALGLLLTELVNGLFNEFKVLIRQGAEAGKTLFEDIRARLSRVIAAVARKIPGAIGQMFQGGVSGFMSNLLTFLINNVLSTAKRFVTVIREGLLGLLRAFKMLVFPPKHMTKEQSRREGLKILSTVVITSVGLLLNETVILFMASLPVLQPVAELVSPVLIGIMTGLLSAFLAYKIDCLFDRHARDEKQLDLLISDARQRDAFASELSSLCESALGTVENYTRSIALYQATGAALGSAGLSAQATLASLERTTISTRQQIERSTAATHSINQSQAEIEDFLKTL